MASEPLGGRALRKSQVRPVSILWALPFSLFFFAGCCCAATVAVNPVKDWTPIVTEFQIPHRVQQNWYRPLIIDPPFARVQPPTAEGATATGRPTIPKAWRVLKPMVRIRLSGSFREEGEVISGWRVWDDPEGTGISDLEVMRSDKCPQDGYPLRNILRQFVPLVWRIDIWSEYRFRGEEKLRRLSPADEEYQTRIKERILVRDFSLRIYKVEGDYRKLADIRNRVSPEPFWTPEPEYLGYEKPLSEYQSRIYQFRSAPGLYEVQLRAKLYFPELDDQRDTAGETEVDACFRFMCGEPGVRPLSIETQRVP